MSFSGKKIVITGASFGFGQTLAICFAKLGAELFISSRTHQKSAATVDAVRSVVPDALIHAFQADMSKPEEIVKFAIDVNALTPSVDILVNNASYWLSGDITSASDDEIMETINSTLSGAILATKHFLPLLHESSVADIVFMNGTPGLQAYRHPTAHEAFSAAKSGQAAFADRLRHRMRGRGLRVTSIFPPNFKNTSALIASEWDERRDAGATSDDYLTSRNVFDAIVFALSQDRICSIDQIVMSNNGPA